jgi:branched-subunit amino acid transport protein AzlD
MLFGGRPMLEMFWIILACGIGTFLLRWLPFRHARRQHRAESAGSNRMGRWLAGVGPAAISALLMVSVWGVIAPAFAPSQLSRTALALAVVVLVRLVARGGVVLPTLCGALVYGVLGAL